MRFWIENANRHRGAENAAPLPEVMPGFEVIDMRLPPGSEWVCDLCNATILTEIRGTQGEVVPLRVPSDGSYSLCRKCEHETGTKTEWSRAPSCGCPGCKSWMDEVIEAMRSEGRRGG